MWDLFFKLVLPGVTLTVAAVALIVWLSQKFIEHRLQKDLQAGQHALDLKLAAIESELGRMREREQILLSTLQPRRAERISELALGLSEFIEAVKDIVRADGLSSPREEGIKRRDQAYEAVRTSLQKAWLLMPLSAARQVRKFVLDAYDYSVKANMYRTQRKDQFPTEQEGKNWKTYRTDIFPRHEALEEDFRKMLGVEVVEELPPPPAGGSH